MIYLFGECGGLLFGVIELLLHVCDLGLQLFEFGVVELPIQCMHYDVRFLAHFLFDGIPGAIQIIPDLLLHFGLLLVVLLVLGVLSGCHRSLE